MNVTLMEEITMRDTNEVTLKVNLIKNLFCLSNVYIILENWRSINEEKSKFYTNPRY